MRRLTLWLVCIFPFVSLFSQKKDFTYSFYGFVRGDLFYNSRANVAPVDGNFYMYPLDRDYDANGKDINATPNGSFYTFTTRLGLDLAGPMLGSARTSAKIETDFGGFSSSTTMLRIRQAYVALDWEKTQLLIGQTWHPLSGIMPDILNLSSGAPFNPFNRSPMLRLQYTADKVKFTAATIWQLQYLSSGPAGASEDYIKNSGIPEIYAGLDYEPSQGWILGGGGHVISLKPRTVSSMGGARYKVNERMTAFSAEAHLKYTGRNYTFSAKTLLASGIENSAVLGGYGISSIDPTDGKQEYAPFRHSTSWVNFTVGQKWKGSFFAGYSKNLGTDKELANAIVYGKNLDIDQLFMFNPGLSYNLSHWKLGVEYCLSNAQYGTIDLSSGKVKDTHGVTNHRILGLMVYFF